MDRDDLDRLLHVLAELDGSDLHIKACAPPRMRVNGQLRTVDDEPQFTAEETALLAETMMPPNILEIFHAKHEADFAYTVAGLGRFRVNAFMQRSSVALAIRRVRTSASTIADLDLPDVVRKLADEQRGLVLVTGPTGSGKTTTLAAMIDHINHTRAGHVITIEDPVEYLHTDDLAAIDQREVGFDTDSFTSAMRVVLRQDPDVILIGEMRDPETVFTALTAAETGHLVFSTLHTSTATETVNRIVDFFPPHQQSQIRVSLAGALKGTICQRLVDPGRRRRAGPCGRGDGRQRPDPAGHPRSHPDIRHRPDHGRGSVLRDAELRPGARRPARAGSHRSARSHELGVEPARPQGDARAQGFGADGRKLRGKHGGSLSHGD